MHNAGESSAHDVVVVAPVPEHTTYVAGLGSRERPRDRARRSASPSTGSTHRSSRARSRRARRRRSSTGSASTRRCPMARGSSANAHRRFAGDGRLRARGRLAWSFVRRRILATTAPRFRSSRRTTCVPASASRWRWPHTTPEPRPPRTSPHRSSCPMRWSAVRGASSIDGRAGPRSPQGTAALRSRAHRRRRTGRAARRSGRRLAAARRHGLDAGGPAVVEAARRGGQRRFERTLDRSLRTGAAAAPQRASNASAARVVKPGDGDRRLRLLSPTTAARRPATSCSTCASIPALDDVRVFEKNVAPDRWTATRSISDRSTRTPRGRLTLRARVRSPYADRSEVRDRRQRALRANSARRRWAKRSGASIRIRRFEAEIVAARTGQRRDPAPQPARGRRRRADQHRHRRRAQRPAATLRFSRSATGERRRCDPREILARLRRNSAGRDGPRAAGAAPAAQPGQGVSGDRRRRPDRRRDASGAARAPDDRDDRRAGFFGRYVPQRSDATWSTSAKRSNGCCTFATAAMGRRGACKSRSHNPKRSSTFPNSTTVNDVPVRDVGALAPFAARARHRPQRSRSRASKRRFAGATSFTTELPAGEAIVHVRARALRRRPR